MEIKYRLKPSLTSGFYPMPYVEQGRPQTPGVAAGPEVQQPEVRLYERYGNANDASHNKPSFYSPPGYTQCVYPNGVQYTPFPEIQRFSHPDSAPNACQNGVSHPSQEVEIRQKSYLYSSSLTVFPDNWK